MMFVAIHFDIGVGRFMVFGILQLPVKVKAKNFLPSFFSFLQRTVESVL